MSKVFNMVGGGGGVTASIFVTGLSETNTVTATNGSKTLAGKWKSDPNPAFHGLPDGYTELEYIESTGTQYIDTGITITQNIGVYLDFVLNNAISSSNVGSFFGGRDSTNSCWICSYNRYQTGSFDFGSTKYEAFLVSGKRMQLELKEQTYTTSEGGNISLPTTSFNTNLSAYLFAVNNRGTAHEYANLRLYSSKLYDGSTVIRNFIPAKRISNSTIGLYDIVNDVFYTNAGTGTFTAGPEIPKTVDGFLIKPIRDFGTWTVTATDGTDTYTQDVLVDVITEYEIEITKKLYLYRDGDECEDVTGGWSFEYKAVNYGGVDAYTNNVIQSLANFKKLYVDVEVTEGVTAENGYLCFNLDGTKGYFKTLGRATYEYDLSDYEYLTYPLRFDVGGGTAGSVGSTLIAEKQDSCMKLLYNVNSTNRQILIYRVWAE